MSGTVPAELLGLEVAADSGEGVWYHVTFADFEQFSLEPGERRSHDWNCFLGIHFSRDLEGIYQFIDAETYDGSGQGPRTVEAELSFANPLRVGDEYAFDQLALRSFAEMNNWSAAQLTRKVVPGRMPLDERMRREFDQWMNGEGFIVPRGYRHFLNHPDRCEAVARSVRTYLDREGFDGVIYGSLFDGFPNVSAIALDPAQIGVLEDGFVSAS